MNVRLRRGLLKLDHLGRKLLELLDSESVRPFQTIVYSMFVVGGLYMLLFGGEPTAVNEAMGSGMHYAWIALLILGPIVVVGGCTLEDRYVGLWFQLGGNAAVIFALLAFTLAILQMYYLAAAIFTLGMSIALAVCVLLLMFRDMRRLRLTQEVAKELERRNE